MPYRLSREARADIREIVVWLGRRNPVAARKLSADLVKACEELSARPSLGHARMDLTDVPEVLFYCVRDIYLVIYRRNTETLQIVRVLHGARDVAAQLEDLS